MVWSDYTWIFVCSIFLAVFVAWGIGANDVANSFATSVGARALTLRQAVLVAAVCEFGGAMLLGSGVTSTIRKGIAKPEAYTYSPELLMYGMLCAMLSAGLWLALATFLELPVSTTHSMIGAIIGMSMVAAGADSVIWYKAPKGGDNPFPGGVVSIVLAWFITPAMAAVVAGLLFVFTKVAVLHARNPFKMSLVLFPLYTFITIWVITYFVIQKGVNGWMKNETYTGTLSDPPSCPAGADPSKDPKVSSSQATEDCQLKSLDEIEVTLTGCKIPDGTAAWIAAVTAAVCALIVGVGLKLVIKLVNRDMAEYENMVAAKEAKAAGAIEDGAGKEEGSEEQEGSDDYEPGKPRGRTPAALTDMRRSRAWKALTSGMDHDIHDVVDTDEKIKDIHSHAEVFDVKTEFSFKYLQVITACANSFAHGANDVANSIGSFAAVYSIWNCFCADSKAQVPIWMFVIGGVGIVLGLATYGYKIMRALGVKMTKITNSRGYCAELTSSIVVIVASRYGFPVSTTQVITGAITGIGLAEVIGAKMRGQPRPSSSYNWLLLLKFFCGWVATVVVAALVAAAFTAQGIYAPDKNGVDARANFNAAFNEVNEGIADTLIAAGNVTNPTADQQQAYEWGLTIAQLNEEIADSGSYQLLDPNSYLYVYNNGTYFLGNATLNGVLDNAFAPVMPLQSDDLPEVRPEKCPGVELSDEQLEAAGFA
jgi:sodium-dependent phosphate transporter